MIRRFAGTLSDSTYTNLPIKTTMKTFERWTIDDVEE
jgi:hypothetical protein